MPGGITGNGNMLADYMKCDGSETNLLQCLIHGISHNGGQCVSGRSAAVKCITGNWLYHEFIIINSIFTHYALLAIHTESIYKYGIRLKYMAHKKHII